jgi:hypothetical protein
MHAVVVACDICSSNPMLVPVKLMAEAIKTLQDNTVCADEFFFACSRTKYIIPNNQNTFPDIC